MNNYSETATFLWRLLTAFWAVFALIGSFLLLSASMPNGTSYMVMSCAILLLASSIVPWMFLANHHKRKQKLADIFELLASDAITMASKLLVTYYMDTKTSCVSRIFTEEVPCSPYQITYRLCTAKNPSSAVERHYTISRDRLTCAQASRLQFVNLENLESLKMGLYGLVHKERFNELVS